MPAMRPAGLVTRAKARAMVSVEVLVDEDVVAPVRIVLELIRNTAHPATPILIAQEDIRDP